MTRQKLVYDLIFANLVSARSETTKGRFSQRKAVFCIYALCFSHKVLLLNILLTAVFHHGKIYSKFIQHHCGFRVNILKCLGWVAVIIAAFILTKLGIHRLGFFLKAVCRVKHGLSHNEKEGFKWKRLCG